MKKTRGPLVCVLAYDGLCTFEFGIAVEVFGQPRPEFDEWYRFRTIAAERGPLRAVGGTTVTATHDLSLLRRASLVVVPGWRGADAPVPAPLRRALIAAHARGARLASICSGVFVLAQCGFLDGRRATTHWAYTAELSRRFPQIGVEPDVLYVDEGDVLTSAGSAAGLDLCLHIVRRDFGVERANAVARCLVMPTHRNGGQSQFIPRPLPKAPAGNIAELLDTVRERIDEDWSIARLAKAGRVSSRTLLRRFREATSESPQTWLTAERIERAKELLEMTELGVKEIAAAAGFRSPETFRHHFRVRTGTSPQMYRMSFSSAAAS